MRIGVRAVAMWLLAFPLSLSAQRAPFTGLDDYITRAIKAWEVPGLGLAIVRNDSVVHARGYGVRRLGDTSSVTDQTLFAIGSSSKAFTAALVAMLVDEGKLAWDDKVADRLPGFQMFDPYVTRELTLRDALSHRSGLSRGDRLWFANDFDREEILRRVRHIEPTWSLRSTFGYQNLMYLASGQVVARAVGKSWDQFIQERLFAPLGMTRSSTSITRLAGVTDVSTPHARLEGRVEAIPWRNIDNIAPAGSINSTARDMAQWVRLQLGRGTFGGAALIRPASMREMHSPNTVIRGSARQDSLYPETHLRAYALGWFLEDYRGRLVVHHGGNIDGMSALVLMVPEERFGMVILTNMNGSGLPAALARRIVDQHLGGPVRDWGAHLLAAQEAQRAAQATQSAQPPGAGGRGAVRVSGTKPSLATDRYAGTFESELYGTIEVRHASGTLSVNGLGLDGPIEHWHFDTFRATPADRMVGRPMIVFSLDAQGRIARLTIDGLGDFPRRNAGRGGA